MVDLMLIENLLSDARYQVFRGLGLGGGTKWIGAWYDEYQPWEINICMMRDFPTLVWEKIDPGL